jgi:hypothetical protein
MQWGRSPQEAVREALTDALSLPDVGDGELQLHAIDTRGNHDVAFIGPRDAKNWHVYYVASGDDPAPVRQDAYRLEA